jgi:hypothetical protein
VRKDLKQIATTHFSATNSSFQGGQLFFIRHRNNTFSYTVNDSQQLSAMASFTNTYTVKHLQNLEGKRRQETQHKQEQHKCQCIAQKANDKKSQLKKNRQVRQQKQQEAEWRQSTFLTEEEKCQSIFDFEQEL